MNGRIGLYPVGPTYTVVEGKEKIGRDWAFNVFNLSGERAYTLPNITVLRMYISRVGSWILLITWDSGREHSSWVSGNDDLNSRKYTRILFGFPRFSAHKRSKVPRFEPGGYPYYQWPRNATAPVMQHRIFCSTFSLSPLIFIA